jgi:hypothetical protein
MKKILVLGFMVLLVFSALAFAGPTLGVRTWPGSTAIPSLGVQYDGPFTPFVEVFKTDIWDLSWSGTYAVEGGLALPFTWGVTPMKVPIGVLVPIDVDIDPLTFEIEPIWGVVGLWVDGGHGNALRFEGLYNGTDWMFVVGVHADIHGLWLMLSPVENPVEEPVEPPVEKGVS